MRIIIIIHTLKIYLQENIFFSYLSGTELESGLFPVPILTLFRSGDYFSVFHQDINAVLVKLAYILLTSYLPTMAIMLRYQLVGHVFINSNNHQYWACTTVTIRE